MASYVEKSGLKVANALAEFVEERVLPGTGIAADAFWAGAAQIFGTFTPRNRALLEKRDALQVYLKDNGIGTEVYYPQPLHLQNCFADLGYRAGDFPVSERLAQSSLALPVYPELTPEDIEYVCQAVKAFYA